MGGTTTLGGHVGCALLVGCNHGPEGLGLDGDKVIRTFIGRRVLPLKIGTTLVGVPRPDRPYN